MTDTRLLQGLLALTGQTLGPSEWRTLTERSVNRLEELTRGEARLKVDPAGAQQHALAEGGGTIVPGFVTLAVGQGQLQHLLEAYAPLVRRDVSAERIRFITPVMIGQVIRTQASVRELVSLADGAEMHLEVHVDVLGSDKPACVVDQVVRWYFE